MAGQLQPWANHLMTVGQQLDLQLLDKLWKTMLDQHIHITVP
jgi:hypothetical protein